MSDFGIFAQNQILKVTNEVKTAGSILIIPCQIGFKQKDGTWVNDWVDVIVFEDLKPQAEGIHKGDKITVSGRVQMKEYKDKKSLQILASCIGRQEKADNPPPDSVPF